MRKNRQSTFSLGRKERRGNLGERIEGVRVQRHLTAFLFSTVFSAAELETMAKPAQVRKFSPFCSTSPGPGLFLESLASIQIPGTISLKGAEEGLRVCLLLLQVTALSDVSDQ